jgi:type IX secretion system PorP/SprF family membrane protein
MILLQKYTILVCILISHTLIWSVGICQDTYFADVLHGNLNENPSALSIDQSSLVKLSYKNQWPGAGKAYINYDALLNITLNSLNSNIYTTFNRNSQGNNIVTIDHFGIGYGYNIKLNRQINFMAGFNVSYNNRTMNYSGLTFEDGSIIGNLNNENQNFFDYSVGFTTVIHSQHQIGISVNHITEPVYGNSYPGIDRLYRKYTISYIAEYGLGSSFDVNRMTLTPAVFLFRQYPYTMTIIGAKLFISPVYFGLWLHQNNVTQFSAATILLGTSIEKIEFNYSYDINLSDKQIFSSKMGSHEVTFLYKFEYKERRKKRKAINCPKL